jgi:hypothetical protein
LQRSFQTQSVTRRKDAHIYHMLHESEQERFRVLPEEALYYTEFSEFMSLDPSPAGAAPAPSTHRPLLYRRLLAELAG